MSIDVYKIRQEDRWVRLEWEELELRATPYYVDVNDNFVDWRYYLPTLEEAEECFERHLMLRQKECLEKGLELLEGGTVGLYDHGHLIRGQSIYGSPEEPLK